MSWGVKPQDKAGASGEATRKAMHETMTFQELLHHACTHPLMYGATFREVAQFLNGYDAGFTAALKQSDPEAEPEMAYMSRFRQWLAVRMGSSPCRFWETIIAEAFPDDETRFRQTVILFDEFTSSREKTCRPELEPLNGPG